MATLLKTYAEDVSKMSPSLITVLRLLHNLAIPPQYLSSLADGGFVCLITVLWLLPNWAIPPTHPHTHTQYLSSLADGGFVCLITVLWLLPNWAIPPHPHPHTHTHTQSICLHWLTVDLSVSSQFSGFFLTGLLPSPPHPPPHTHTFCLHWLAVFSLHAFLAVCLITMLQLCLSQSHHLEESA